MTPSRNEHGESASLSAHHEEMNIVRTVNNRDAGVILTLVILRQVPVIDLAIPMTISKINKSIAVVMEEIVADIRARPAMFCNGVGMLKPKNDSDMPAQNRAV